MLCRQASQRAIGKRRDMDMASMRRCASRDFARSCCCFRGPVNRPGSVHVARSIGGNVGFLSGAQGRRRRSSSRECSLALRSRRQRSRRLAVAGACVGSDDPSVTWNVVHRMPDDADKQRVRIEVVGGREYSVAHRSFPRPVAGEVHAAAPFVDRLPQVAAIDVFDREGDRLGGIAWPHWRPRDATARRIAESSARPIPGSCAS
jgi:hypothetical protein